MLWGERKVSLLFVLMNLAGQVSASRPASRGAIQFPFALIPSSTFGKDASIQAIGGATWA